MQAFCYTYFRLANPYINTAYSSIYIIYEWKARYSACFKKYVTSLICLKYHSF